MNNIEIKNIKGVITMTTKDGAETTTEVPVQEMLVSEPMANVGYSTQFTKNLGNYESAKISVSLHLPTTIPDLEKSYAFVKDWVDAKMTDCIVEISS